MTTGTAAGTATDVVIVGAVRSPVVKGRRDGAFSGLHPVDLLAQVLEGLVSATGVDAGAIDDVIAGCVSQVGEQSSNIGRNAALAAGFPDTVPGTTVDRQCGSSQQAVTFAAQAIRAGDADLVVACGVESMSRVPMFTNTLGGDPYGARIAARYEGGLVPQGISAELVAAKWAIDRAAMDAFALRSHERASRARADDTLGRSIVPVVTPDGSVIDADNGIRADSSLEALSALRPAFVDEEQGRRFGQIEWSVTAGNSSQISDGAAAVLLASRARAEQLGLPVRARFVAGSVVGDDPITMLSAVIPATERVLDRTGLALADIDAFEVNEAFACVPLAWAAELGVPLDVVNRFGGAVALGHPLGASGVRLLTTLLDVLDTGGGRFGLQTMCEAGGLANATVVERISS